MASSSGTGREYPPELVHGELCRTRFNIHAECDCGKSEPAPPGPASVSPAEPPTKGVPMYDVEQVRDLLIEAAQGKRPDDDWLRSIEGASAIDGEPGTFGISVAGQEFFVSVEAA